MIGLGDIGFYALLIGLLVATELEALRTRAAAEGFYALLIGLLVATWLARASEWADAQVSMPS